MSEAKPAPEPWNVYSLTGHLNVYLLRRQTPHGYEFMQTPSGFPRHFRSLEKARAAIAKAEGRS